MSARTYAFTDLFMATLAANGVTDAVVSPGSRSTPLAVSADDSDMETWVHIDERSAGYFALGLARARRRPVLLICTSGTAAANYLPAVVEASHGGHPLVVCTADRPPELRGWGGGQTIDQINIYGTNVRWFHELPVPDEVEADLAAAIATAAILRATGQTPGPVHCNWPLREPLQPPADRERVEGRAGRVATAARHSEVGFDLLVELAGDHERGVVLAGPADNSGETADAIATFARAAGWPVIADPASQLRRGRHAVQATIISTAELLMADADFGAAHAPEVVVTTGGPLTSKSTRSWLGTVRPAEYVVVDPGRDWPDPDHLVTRVIGADPGPLFAAAGPGVASLPESAWLAAWRSAEIAADAARCADRRWSEIAVARLLADALPKGAALVVGNSMPVRDLDVGMTVGPDELVVVANRGASGIDGVTSSALGFACAHRGPVALLTGDVALVHDIAALAAHRRLDCKLLVVVIDNSGGGIFAGLPVADAVEPKTYDRLFRTDPEVPIADLARLGGMELVAAESAATLDSNIAAALGSSGSTIITVETTAATTIEALAALRSETAERLAATGDR